MNDFWQDGAAIGAVALAGGYLLRRAWLLFGRPAKRGCGAGCGGCPAKANISVHTLGINVQAK
jgi:hypothetical protein